MNNFEFSPFFATPRIRPCRKWKAVNLIVDSIVNKNLTPQQQVLALREALVRTCVRIFSKSAGVIDNTLFDTFEYVLKNMSEVIFLLLGRQQARKVEQIMIKVHWWNQW